MIIRIVKLTFTRDTVPSFLDLFEQQKTNISTFKGCVKLELLRDITDPNVFFTYSHWENELDLENYRNSEFFKGVWSKTKALFADKPYAWSTELLDF